MRTELIAALGIGLTIAAHSASAHHSFAAEFGSQR
jgi:hypothetical protein